MYLFFCFKQKAAYEVRISDWSSDVCSSDLFTRHVLVCLHRGRTGRRGRTLARAVRSHGRRPRAGRLAFVPEARQLDALGNLAVPVPSARLTVPCGTSVLCGNDFGAGRVGAADKGAFAVEDRHQNEQQRGACKYSEKEGSDSSQEQKKGVKKDRT